MPSHLLNSFLKFISVDLQSATNSAAILVRINFPGVSHEGLLPQHTFASSLNTQTFVIVNRTYLMMKFRPADLIIHLSTKHKNIVKAKLRFCTLQSIKRTALPS
jgi:hypothetical protein